MNDAIYSQITIHNTLYPQITMDRYSYRHNPKIADELNKTPD